MFGGFFFFPMKECKLEILERKNIRVDFSCIGHFDIALDKISLHYVG